MKIAVVGAGAIGGYVGGWLAAAGEEVTFIARGANLAAIKQNGLRVIGEDRKSRYTNECRNSWLKGGGRSRVRSALRGIKTLHCHALRRRC